MRIVCLGDSITLGVRPGLLPEQTFEAVLAGMLANDGIAVEVINAGVGGETTSGGLARFHEAVVEKHPDYVTIMYGTNDSAVDEERSSPRLLLPLYERNLRTLVDDARSAGISPILMTPIPLGEDWSYTVWSPYRERGANCVIVSYVDAVRNVAVEERVPLVDNFQAWREWEKSTGAGIESLQTDSCHPNPAGHDLIARTLHAAITPLLGPRQAP